MKRRMTEAGLEAEVRTWTDQISGHCLMRGDRGCLQAPQDRWTHDAPYIPGYSTDEDTVFTDRHLPRTMRLTSGPSARRGR